MPRAPSTSSGGPRSKGGPTARCGSRWTAQARSTFLRNRIGFCVLHPIRECAGARCRLTHADGTTREAEFPRLIAPQNPFLELIGLSHEVSPGLWAELRFEGDVFETEDQRNWIDGSFKTFCTPLRLPFPVEIPAGTRVHQAVSLTISGPADRSPRSEGTIAFRFQADSAMPLPEIGLGLPPDGPWPSASQVELLRRLNPSHLRVDLDLGGPGWRDLLGRAFDEAEALGCFLDIAVSAEGDDEMRRLAEVASTRRHRVGRWLVFSRGAWSTAAALVESARRILGPIDGRIPLVAGTVANFLELNRARLPWEQLDGICFSAHPQEHASDNASLVENLEGLASAIESARVLGTGAPGRGRPDHAPEAREPLRDGAGRRAGSRGASRARGPAPDVALRGRLDARRRSSTWPSSGPRGRPSTRPPGGSA